MNGKHNRSIVSGLVLAGLVVSSVQARSQTVVHDWESWRQGRNITGLCATSSPRTGIAGPLSESHAALTGSLSSGGFRSQSDAPTLWTFGATAGTEAYVPVAGSTHGLLLQGDFSFQQKSGKEMMGSMFVHPGYYPIDVLEFTPGPKVMQTYGIGGGIAWMTDGPWTPGCTLRFEGTNYAKRKDLRHTTYRQELEIVPSLSFEGEGFVLGASVIFGKTSEFVQAEQIGSATAESYYAFLDKGLMFGTCQVWNGSGIHLAEAGVDRLPVKEISGGAALQAEIGNFLYGDIEYVRSRGEVGEKGYTWFRFPGATAAGTLQYTWHGADGVHVFRVHSAWERKETDETVMERISSGGVTTPVEYGSNRIFRERNLSVNPFIGFYRNDGFILTASAALTHEKQLSTLMYPFLYLDEATTLHMHATATIPMGSFLWNFALESGGNVGEHQHVVDNADASLGVVSEPFQMKEWLETEQELDDASRIGGTIGLQYGFSLGADRKLTIGAECHFVHAFAIEHLPGANRQVSLLKLGYEF